MLATHSSGRTNMLSNSRRSRGPVFNEGSPPVQRVRQVIRLTPEQKTKGVDFAAQDFEERRKFMQNRRAEEAAQRQLELEATLGWRLRQWWRNLWTA